MTRLPRPAIPSPLGDDTRSQAASRRAGHPLSFGELDPPIPDEQARFALANAHLIRERFVIGDLLWWLGLSGGNLADDLLDG